MATKKSAKTSKTDHVLHLLSSPDEEPSPAVSQRENSAPTPVQPVPAPVQSQLSPPILEVARTNNEAVEGKIHDALEQALMQELEQQPPKAEETIPAAVPAAPTEEDLPPAAPLSNTNTPEPSAADLSDSSACDTDTVPSSPTDEEALSPQITGDLSDSSAASTPPRMEWEISLADGARFINVMPILVEEKLERYVKLFHLCNCPRCLADAMALALSRLPAKYVVLSEGACAPMMNLYRAKYESTVTAQVIFACKEVLEHPRHQLDDH